MSTYLVTTEETLVSPRVAQKPIVSRITQPSQQSPKLAYGIPRWVIPLGIGALIVAVAVLSDSGTHTHGTNPVSQQDRDLIREDLAVRARYLQKKYGLTLPEIRRFFRELLSVSI